MCRAAMRGRADGGAREVPMATPSTGDGPAIVISSNTVAAAAAREAIISSSPPLPPGIDSFSKFLKTCCMLPAHACTHVPGT